jgi:hypothetical protein
MCAFVIMIRRRDKMRVGAVVNVVIVATVFSICDYCDWCDSFSCYSLLAVIRSACAVTAVDTFERWDCRDCQSCCLMFCRRLLGTISHKQNTVVPILHCERRSKTARVPSINKHIARHVFVTRYKPLAHPYDNKSGLLRCSVSLACFSFDLMLLGVSAG